MSERFIKISWGFPDHWKTAELTDRAFRELVTAWCFCAQNQTDGALTTSQARRLFTRYTAPQLLAVGFMHNTPTGYQMHGFDEWQQTAAEYADLHEKRAAAGKAGGKAKAKRIANAREVAKQTPSKPVAEVEVDKELDKTTTPVSPPSSVPPPKTTAKGTRLSEDFEVTEAMREWAAEFCPGVDLHRSTMMFRNYWLAKPGRDGVKLDWLATWRNWIMRDAASTRPMPRTTVGGKQGERKFYL